MSLLSDTFLYNYISTLFREVHWTRCQLQLYAKGTGTVKDFNEIKERMCTEIKNEIKNKIYKKLLKYIIVRTKDAVAISNGLFYSYNIHLVSIFSFPKLLFTGEDNSVYVLCHQVGTHL